MHGQCSRSFVESYHQSSLYCDCALKRINFRNVFRIGLQVVLKSITTKILYLLRLKTCPFFPRFLSAMS